MSTDSTIHVYLNIPIYIDRIIGLHICRW